MSNVRISKKGRRLLNDKPLARRVVMEVIKQRDKLANGETITVDGKIEVTLATSIKDKKHEIK